jgi:hypothetical protein
MPRKGLPRCVCGTCDWQFVRWRSTRVELSCVACGRHVCSAAQRARALARTQAARAKEK